MVKQMRWVVPSAFVLLMLVGTQGVARAECGSCQVCREKTRLTLPADYCATANDEDGYMCCSPETYGLATYCNLEGAACYGISVGGGGGGGGGGTGGGGGSCSYQNGWCPAECFSCGGGTY